MCMHDMKCILIFSHQFTVSKRKASIAYWNGMLECRCTIQKYGNKVLYQCSQCAAPLLTFYKIQIGLCIFSEFISEQKSKGVLQSLFFTLYSEFSMLSTIFHKIRSSPNVRGHWPRYRTAVGKFIETEISFITLQELSLSSYKCFCQK